MTTKAEFDAALGSADQVIVEGDDELLSYAVSKAAGDPENRIDIQTSTTEIQSPASAAVDGLAEETVGFAHRVITEDDSQFAQVPFATSGRPSALPHAPTRAKMRTWVIVAAACLVIVGAGVSSLTFWHEAGAPAPAEPLVALNLSGTPASAPALPAATTATTPAPPPVAVNRSQGVLGSSASSTTAAIPATSPPVPGGAVQINPSPAPATPTTPALPPVAVNRSPGVSESSASSTTAATPPPPVPAAPVQAQPAPAEKQPVAVGSSAEPDQSANGGAPGGWAAPSALPSDQLGSQVLVGSSERSSSLPTIVQAMAWPLAITVVATVAIIALFLIARQAIARDRNVEISWKVTNKVTGRVVITKVRTPRAVKRAAA